MKQVYMIGNAHIDPVWLWRWREGYQEVKATFLSALDRLDETEDFVFTSACAAYYRWVEESAPEMFERICARVREGRWHIVGGMWVQPDVNMPSGEALARHLLLSMRYFKESFGVDVRTGYNVDSFGQGAGLPQILARSGITDYVFMRPGAHENAEIPGPLFRWQGVDGSEVTAFRIGDAYGSGFGDIDPKIERHLKIADEAGYPVMCFYGVGNHGGGPTIQNLASIEAFRSERPRGAQLCYAGPDAYFDAIRALNPALPRWRGELQHHASGCYSAHSGIKRLNRQAESALVSAERAASMARMLTGHEADGMALLRGWQGLLFNQFHDILCGCSIESAYIDAGRALGEVLSIADREENRALQKISWRVNTASGGRFSGADGLSAAEMRSKEGDFALWAHAGLGAPVVVFNLNGREMQGEVTVHRALRQVRDAEGRIVNHQRVRAERTNGEDKWDTLFLARVPAMGYRLYWVYLEGEEIENGEDAALRAEGCILENSRLRAEFDEGTGALRRLFMKRENREALRAPAEAKLIDIEHVDTWAHGVDRFDKVVGTFGMGTVRVFENGPVRASIQTETKYGASKLVQTYSLRPHSDQLDVDAYLTFHEPFRMVKLCFPTPQTEGRTRAECAYGTVDRAADGREDICLRYAGIYDEQGGLGIVNDGKYSFSAESGELRLTVANSALYADHYGQEHRDVDCRAMDQGEQRFRYAVVPFAGAEPGAALSKRADEMHAPLRAIVETYHEDDLPPADSLIDIESKHLSMTALKRAEDGSGYILRIHETAGRDAESNIELKALSRSFTARFSPYEVKTFHLPDDPKLPVEPRSMTEYGLGE